jgi:hypothetical protein
MRTVVAFIDVLQFGLALLSAFKVRVRESNRSSDRIKSEALRLGRELQESRAMSVNYPRRERAGTNLDPGSDVEESKVSWD